MHASVSPYPPHDSPRHCQSIPAWLSHTAACQTQEQTACASLPGAHHTWSDWNKHCMCITALGQPHTEWDKHYLCITTVGPPHTVRHWDTHCMCVTAVDPPNTEWDKHYLCITEWGTLHKVSLGQTIHVHHYHGPTTHSQTGTNTIYAPLPGAHQAWSDWDRHYLCITAWATLYYTRSD